MLSAAKHLSADRDRPFAALRVTRCDCSNCHVLFFKLNLALEAQLSRVLEQLRMTREQLAAAYTRIEELEKQKTSSPAFVKLNVARPQDGAKKQRKKGDAKYNRAQRREEPTQMGEHQITSCPVCTNRLGRVSVTHRRQVIELPPGKMKH